MSKARELAELSRTVSDSADAVAITIDSNENVTFANDIDVTGTVTADALTVDTNTLVVDATNNRVGIGTSSPSTKLHVGGTAPGDSIIRQDSTASGTNWEIGERSAGKWQIFEDDTDSVVATFMSSGNVGIGTSSPNALLHVGGTAETQGSQANPAIQIGSTSGYRLGMYTDAEGGYIENKNGDDGLIFKVKTVGEAMRIDGGTGAVGIGLSNPTEKLTVVNSSSGIVGRFTNNTNQTLDLGVISGSGSAGGVYYNSANSGHHRFQVGGSTKLKIEASGNVGIGTSSPNASADLHVADTSDARIWVDATSGDTMELYAGTNVSLFNRSNNAVTFGTNNTERMRIDSSGNLLVGKTALEYSSNAGVILRNDGLISSVRSGGNVCNFNRLSSDGEIIQLNKDGTNVGTIGTVSGGLYIASPVSSDSGLRFSGSTVHPCTTSGAPRDNAVDLGYAQGRFDDIYATNGTIQTSDLNEKQDIEGLSEAEQRVAVAAKGLLRKFRWKDSVAEKGDDARIHFGIIAQDLQAAFEAEGLDAGRYAMFTSNTWTDEDTGEERSRMGVRYSELLAFIISAI